MRRIVVVAAVLAAAVHPATSRAGGITGTFVENPGNVPLAAVEIVVRRAADSTVVAHASTSAEGRFRLEHLPPGTYLLRASLLGHLPFVRTDLVVGETSPDLDLGARALAINPVAVPGVAVTSERATAIIAPDRNIYLTRDMPAATSGTAIDILRTVSELDVDIDGHVSLRGSPGVNLQFNGRAAPMKGDALTTYLRQFPASRIERVEVIANPSAKFDPEGAAGIVNIVLKDNVDLGLSGSVYANAGNAFSGPGARVAWQKGPVTVFSGLSGSLGRGWYQNDVARTDLVTHPPGSFASSTLSNYASGNGTFDASVDCAVTKRSTFYGTLNGYRSASDTRVLTQSALSDSAPALTSRYDRVDQVSSNGTSTSFTFGFQNIVQKSRDERTVEFMESDTDNGAGDEGMRANLLPAGLGDLGSRQASASGYHERSIEVDDTHPLGPRGKLELGYRGADRRNTSSSELAYFPGDSGAVIPPGDASDFAFREVFHSAYATAGATFGRWSLQVGARGEVANTTFDVRSSGHRYGNDYRSLFPSANVAWDIGSGRVLRLTYSKRIERPSAGYLNPEVPTTDSLNRFVGNPYLRPKYTHSYGLSASWTGSRGSLQLAPFYRETTGNWDQVTQVNASGVAITTWLNASVVRFYGVSLATSLRQTGRLGGTLGASVYRELHDASNLSSQFQHDATNWSANGNVTVKTTRLVDLQASLRYSPAQTLAQGRTSSYTFESVGARVKLGRSAWANLWLRDPFNLAHSWRSTGDATYAQTSTSHNSIRGVSANLTWTWGEPPEEKPRRQGTEEQPQDATTPKP